MLTLCIIFHVDVDCVKLVLSLTLSFIAKPSNSVFDIRFYGKIPSPVLCFP